MKKMRRLTSFATVFLIMISILTSMLMGCGNVSDNQIESETRTGESSTSEAEQKSMGFTTDPEEMRVLIENDVSGTEEGTGIFSKWNWVLAMAPDYSEDNAEDLLLELLKHPYHYRYYDFFPAEDEYPQTEEIENNDGLIEEDVKWFMLNYFNVSEKGYDDAKEYVLSIDNGKYYEYGTYLPVPSNSTSGEFTIDIMDLRYDNGLWDIKYQAYHKNGPGPSGGFKNAVMGIEEGLDGRPYWTIYSLSVDTGEYLYRLKNWLRDKGFSDRGLSENDLKEICTRRLFTVLLWETAEPSEKPNNVVDMEAMAADWISSRGIWDRAYALSDEAMTRLDAAVALYRFAGQPVIKNVLYDIDVLEAGYKTDSDEYRAIVWNGGNFRRRSVQNDYTVYGCDQDCTMLEIYECLYDLKDGSDMEHYETDPVHKTIGNIGPDISWNLSEDGTLHINGTGDMSYFGDMHNELDLDKVRKIEISDGIKKIGASAFFACENLEEVLLPETIEGIGIAAFAHCKKLKEIYIPDSCWYLSAYAFFGCTEMRYVYLPAGFKDHVSENVFGECYYLKKEFHE